MRGRGKLKRQQHSFDVPCMLLVGDIVDNLLIVKTCDIVRANKDIMTKDDIILCFCVGYEHKYNLNSIEIEKIR